MKKVALITGITGQDGSYLAEVLLKKGYLVYGVIRRKTPAKLSNISHISDKIVLVEGDITNRKSLSNILHNARPNEVYNFAAPSFVPDSWKHAAVTTRVDVLGVINLLEAIRTINPSIKYYQASSAEIFGKAKDVPQNENTPFHPRSPYGVAKLYGHWITVNYREKYDMFACSGILYNHESPRRAPEFVTRKVSYGVAMIKHGEMKKLHMGNLEARRDWGFALDYVKAIWLMLQQNKPEDFVIASGKTHSVRDLLDIAFSHVGLDYHKYVVIDKKFLRPDGDNLLVGDCSKAKKILKWEPTVTFEELVKMMVDYDMKQIKKIS